MSPENANAPHRHSYHINVNGRDRTVETDILTYDQVVALAPNLPPPGDNVAYDVTFTGAVDPKDGDLIAGESVTIKDGTHFVVSPSNRS